MLKVLGEIPDVLKKGRYMFRWDEMILWAQNCKLQDMDKFMQEINAIESTKGSTRKCPEPSTMPPPPSPVPKKATKKAWQFLGLVDIITL